MTDNRGAMWIDSKAARDVEFSGLVCRLWRRKERCLNDPTPLAIASVTHLMQ